MKRNRKTRKQPIGRAKGINSAHKDRLFRLIFRDKSDLLELYNAVNNTSYEDVAALEINTIEDAIYMGVKNDLSFLIEDTMNLYEHQSTVCANLPLRGLFYLAPLYRKYVKVMGGTLYSPVQIKLPLPQYLVFYNGEQGAES